MLIKLNFLLLNESKNEKLITKTLQIFIELSKNSYIAVKLYKIMFNIEINLKTTKNQYSNMLNNYYELAKFDVKMNFYYFHFCKFFTNIIEVK